MTDIFNISDEDFLGKTPEDFFSASSQKLDETDDVAVNSEPEETEPEEVDTPSEEDSDYYEEDESSEPEDDDEDESSEVSDEDELDTEDTNEATEETNYKEVYDELFEPFKAAGSDFQVKDVKEARKLMQMGVDYNRKMAALKPHRKLLKTLEVNNLLDPDKLNFLIDLDKKDPKAIAKLVQESGVDTLSLDSEEDDTYTPRDHTVSDSSVELDEVLEQINSTPTGSKTLSVINTWDDASKGKLVSDPNRIAVLNEHMSNGLYAMIQQRVARERITNSALAGLPDFETYLTVGNQMYAEGLFDENGPIAKSKVVSRKPSKVDTELAERKRKASPSKKSKAKPKPSYDFINMSDEELDNFHF